MLNFHRFLHAMYKCVLNSAVKISVMFAQYWEYCFCILRGRFLVEMLYNTGKYA